MEQLRRQNAQTKRLSKILGSDNTLLNPEKKKKKEIMNNLKM